MTAVDPRADGSFVRVLGVHVAAIDPAGVLDRVAHWLSVSGSGRYICVTGVHGIMESDRDRSLADVHNAADLVVPDGMPLVWCGRWVGFDKMRRCYGPDLMLDLHEAGFAAGWRHYYFGGRPGVAEHLSIEMTRRFGSLSAGASTPPFRELTDAELDEVASGIRASGAQLVWVGLSTPKQERLMARLAPRLERTVCLGVGAAFDFHTGQVRQAPGVLQRLGLEWLFRLVLEPRRLGGRYLRNNPAFVYRILRSRPEAILSPVDRDG